MWGLQEGEEQEPRTALAQTLRTLITPPTMSCFLWKPKRSPQLNTLINQTNSERWHEGSDQRHCPHSSQQGAPNMGQLEQRGRSHRDSPAPALWL